ncbi:hypothetical protein HPP92_028195 [Vanilla planifolia]|uniref:Uncharacterized protein n=1 Tax=Vanilla planifolia TaxID=51239 RepID=A0A835P957_VANPL|nr:hypothetical protein HPP92_028195 [Vanilla planifolia]KAG0447811.1 hypothetical protein HPP92_028175 [Vanilla planifolia]
MLQTFPRAAPPLRPPGAGLPYQRRQPPPRVLRSPCHITSPVQRRPFRANGSANNDATASLRDSGASAVLLGPDQVPRGESVVAFPQLPGERRNTPRWRWRRRAASYLVEPARGGRRGVAWVAVTDFPRGVVGGRGGWGLYESRCR